jgi:omega-amidase
MQDILNICLVQTHLHWENRSANFKHFDKLFSGIKPGTDLVILPETFTSGFVMKRELGETDGATVEWMKSMSAQYGFSIAGSLFVNEKDKFYNRLHFVQPGGTVTIYNKKHLFRLTNEQEVFTPGDKQVVLEYKGWKISLMVCYDLRFPVWLRRTDKNDYDILLLVANWPERRSHAWNTLLQARAIENQSYVVAVNRTGNDGNGFLYAGESGVIDPMGKFIAKGKMFTDELVYAEISHSNLQNIRKALPFYEDRDEFEL